MLPVNYWARLRHLFEGDDGSLPDVYVDGLSPKEQVDIYTYVLTCTDIYDNPNVWSLTQEKDVLIKDLENPAQLYIDGEIETFRHGLMPFAIEGVEIPQLSICITKSCIEFDYRMGKEWTESSLLAFFQFIKSIKSLAPNAKIYQTDEGKYQTPNVEFSELFEKYNAGY